MMKLLILNGPNINMLEYRSDKHYGNLSYDDLITYIEEHETSNDIDLEFVQTNVEGEIVSIIQSLVDSKFDGLIINPAAYSHYSIAIYDALLLLDIPIVEVHLSDVENREDFRKQLITSKACEKTFSGLHKDSYIEAIKYFKNKNISQ